MQTRTFSAFQAIVVRQATVEVHVGAKDGPLATDLLDENGNPLDNPFQIPSNGRATFQAENGSYWVHISGPGFDVWEPAQFFDVADVGFFVSLTESPDSFAQNYSRYPVEIGYVVRVNSTTPSAEVFPSSWKCTADDAALPSGATPGELYEGDLYLLKSGSDYYKFEYVGEGRVDEQTGAVVALREDLASNSPGKGARIIAYILRYAGAVKRWVEDRLSENVSILDFGAIGDGTAHKVTEWIAEGRFESLDEIKAEYPHVESDDDYIDWVAFQQALNILPDGAVLNVPKSSGDYVINRGLERNNLSLRVKGAGVIFLDNEDDGENVIVFNDCPSASFEGVGVTSSKTTELHSAASQGVVFNGCAKAYFGHAEVTYRTDAVRFYYCGSAIAEAGDLHELGEEGIVFHGCRNPKAILNEIYHHNGDGILLKQGDETGPPVIIGNTIRDGVDTYGYDGVIGGGITNNDEVTGSAGAYQGITIVGNILKNIKYGVSLTVAGKFTIVGNTCIDVNQQGVSVYGSAVNNPSGITQELGTISSNTIDGAKQGGIVVVSGEGVICRWCQITGNTVSNVGDPDNVDVPGIGAHDCLVTGNRVTNAYVLADLTRCKASSNIFEGSPRWVASGPNPSIKLVGKSSFCDNDFTDEFGLIRITDYSGALKNNTVDTGNSNWLRVQGAYDSSLDLRGNVLLDGNGIDLQVGSGWSERTVRDFHEYYGSLTQTSSSVSAGTTSTFAITVYGARNNDMVHISGSEDLLGLIVSGHVSADNTVTVRLYNPTSNTISFGSIVWRATTKRRL